MNKKLNSLLLVALIGLTFFFTSCSNDDEPEAEPVLVSSELFINVDKELSFQILQALEVDVAESDIEYDVELYNIVYNTTYKDEQIQASGVVVLPKDVTEPIGMLSFQHGTMVSDAETPTLEPVSGQTRLLYASIGSAGLIGAVPDYIGYAASTDIVHPYFIPEPNSTSIKDMMLAARELAEQNGISFSGDLYLAGYSEGAYNTMATHRSLQQEGLDGFNVQAAFMGGGVYSFQTSPFAQDIPVEIEPTFIAFKTHSYLEHFDFDLELTDFFKEPYASRIPDLFDGTNSFGEISSQLNPVVNELMADNFLTGFTTDPIYTDYINEEAASNLLNWVPSARVYFYHSDTDETADYQNSVQANSYFLENGAATQNVSFTTVTGLSHVEAAFPWIGSIFETLVDEI